MLRFRYRHPQHVLTAVLTTVIEAPSIQQIDVARVVQTWYALNAVDCWLEQVLLWKSAFGDANDIAGVNQAALQP